MSGIFFEDLNHAADGGLYGELVRNRSFEFDAVDAPGFHAMTAWEVIERGGGISNEGYFPGITVELGKNYIFSFDYRLRSKRHIPLEIRLESADGSRCYAKDNFYPEKWAAIRYCPNDF